MRAEPFAFGAVEQVELELFLMTRARGAIENRTFSELRAQFVSGYKTREPLVD